MKGIILAGGQGTRLRPLTYITNKHLLPIFNKPMIDYAIDQLASILIEDILIITGKEHCGDFTAYLGGERYINNRRVRFTYKVQDRAIGIAHALMLAQDFIGDQEKFPVLLGDNIFGASMAASFNSFIFEPHLECKLFTKTVDNPERFGVVQYEPTLNGNPTIIEKPDVPPSRDAVTGMYFYSRNVFDKIYDLTPSARGELEITDINNWYLARGNTSIQNIICFWSDAGTFESLYVSSRFAREFLKIKVEKDNTITGNGEQI